MQTNIKDISEDEILNLMPEVLDTLLRDHTLSGTDPSDFRHISWKTHCGQKQIIVSEKNKLAIERDSSDSMEELYYDYTLFSRIRSHSFYALSIFEFLMMLCDAAYIGYFPPENDNLIPIIVFLVCFLPFTCLYFMYFEIDTKTEQPVKKEIRDKVVYYGVLYFISAIYFLVTLFIWLKGFGIFSCAGVGICLLTRYIFSMSINWKSLFDSNLKIVLWVISGVLFVIPWIKFILKFNHIL